MLTWVYGGCLTWSCASVRVCNLHNIAIPVKTAFIELEKDLV